MKDGCDSYNILINTAMHTLHNSPLKQQVLFFQLCLIKEILFQTTSRIPDPEVFKSRGSRIRNSV